MPGVKTRYAERSKSRLYKLDQVKDKPKPTPKKKLVVEPAESKVGAPEEATPTITEVEDTSANTGSDTVTVSSDDLGKVSGTGSND
jgi:hypothetical protein